MPENYAGKSNKMLEFYVIFALKIIKTPKTFYDICRKKITKFRILHICPKNIEFYAIIARKIFFPILGEGARASLPPSPTPMHGPQKLAPSCVSLLPPPGGIAIRHVCLFVGWLVRQCVSSFINIRPTAALAGTAWQAPGGPATGGQRQAGVRTINIAVSLRAPGGGLRPTSAYGCLGSVVVRVSDL